MNENNHLILVKHEDKTLTVQNYRYSDGFWYVKFENYPEYKYTYSSVETFHNPKVIDISNKDIVISDCYMSNVTKILNFGIYSKVFLSDGTKMFTRTSSIKTEEVTTLQKSKNVFLYLRRIAYYLKMDIDNDSSFLGEQYKKINFVKQSSTLYRYLYRHNIDSRYEPELIIYPFGLNLSQIQATTNAFSQQISIIEGPPGTGKTQTILNIIANAILQDKTIAIVSNNNSATQNVQEKLEQLGFGFLCAFLGSNDNKLSFIENQNTILPDMKDWSLSNNALSNLKFRLNKDLTDMKFMNRLSNDLAIKRETLANLIIEYEHYKSFQDNEFHFNKKILKISSSRIEQIESFFEKHSVFTWITRLLFYYRFHIQYSLIAEKDSFLTSKKIHELYYRSLINEVEDEIRIIEDKLLKYDFKEKTKEYTHLSIQFFKAHLSKKYGTNYQRIKYQGMFYNMEDLQRDYPVILSTTFSILNLSREEYMFDYIVVDEASQADIVSGSLALSVGKNAVIVGDEMQLPHVISTETRKGTDLIFENFDVDNAYRYQNSLLSSVKKVFKNEIKTTLLKEHYRCHPDIIGFCNQKFYHNELIIHTEHHNKPAIEVFVSSSGNHAREHFNQREIDIINQEVLPQIEDGMSVGVITPFREQANKIRELIQNQMVDSDTVHKYQGRERDIVILSTVSNEINPGSFVDNSNLINVAVSRAKKKLILVTSEDILYQKNTNIKELKNYILYKNIHAINHSKVISVFDTLYRKHSRDIELIYQKPRKVSEYKSENIIYELLTKILKKEEFSSYKLMMHYPLRELIQDFSKCTKEETVFGRNALTHVDFLIYNYITKEPILVVEVDGYAFHNQNMVQLERDKKKDSILSKYQIQILRLNTTGSDEESRVLEVLNQN